MPAIIDFAEAASGLTDYGKIALNVHGGAK